MKSSQDFKKAIQAYLDLRAKTDKLFAVSYAKTNKNLDDCCNYILGEAKKRGNAVAMTDEEETARRQELLLLRKEQNLPDGEFYHYDTPLTVEHEKEALIAAGFSDVQVLREWGTTVTLRAIKEGE